MKNPYHNNPYTHDITTWHGVETENGRVTKILWNTENLKNLVGGAFVPSGEIPKELGSLVKLRKLDLGGGSKEGGELKGWIPTELSNLEVSWDSASLVFSIFYCS